ncbi:MAG: cyanophycin synthetase [Candidatus Saccharibacteria bacterium]|nr:cyanophycin synthetase [Candidatus Saccharibacteria bacterium]
MNNTSLRDQLQISTRIIYDELIRRDIAVDILDIGSSLLEYTDSHDVRHFIFSTCSDKSSATGLIIANSKARTAAIAIRLGIPVPAQIISRDIRKVRKLLSVHKQIVIKPVLGSGGKGVSTNITSNVELKDAYMYAKKYNHDIVAQQYINGDDVRLLVIDGVFCSAVTRKPAHVIGDGISTIRELIIVANGTVARNDDSRSSLMHINQNAAARFLGDSIDHVVVKSGEEVRVVGPANVSLGGSLHEATHLVSSAMIADAEAITKKLGLGICGVDMMWDQTTNKHYLIEVNATPGIDIHNDPFSGTSSDCVSRYVDWLISSPLHA